METIFSELLLNRERCFVCGGVGSEFSENVERSVRDSIVYPMCASCFASWHYGMGWYAGRYGRVGSGMVPADVCACVEMLWTAYHTVVSETGVAEHERTRAVKRALHGLDDSDTLERSDLFYSDLFHVLREYSGEPVGGRNLGYFLERYGYFGVYEKLLARLDESAITVVYSDVT